MSLSKLENLANETFLDMFDFLRPIDLVQAFATLNQRLQTLLDGRQMHVDLASNISFADFNSYCSQIFVDYAIGIVSIRLSNIETCGAIKLFFTQFQQIEQVLPNLRAMSFSEPNDIEFKQIVKLKQLTSINIKMGRMHEQQIHAGTVFDMPNLKTCVLSYDDILPVVKLRPNPYLERLVLDGFYVNELHTLFRFFPALKSLNIHRLVVNFRGFLPPIRRPLQAIRTLKLNCTHPVRFDYVAHILAYLPRLIRLTVVAIGADFLNAEQWIRILTPLEQLRVLILDIKAISTIFDDDLSSSFLTGFWRRWHVAVDYSQDNNKFHLFTVPYRRVSFISTLHCLPVTEAPIDAHASVTNLYLKTNMPMQVRARRAFPRVRALQIYQNAVVPVDYPSLFKQLNSMLYLYKLVHLELFVPLPPSTFLTLLKLTSHLRYLKTDYDVLLSVTDRLRHGDVCNQLTDKLDKFVLRRGALPIIDSDRFLKIFFRVKHLHLNLNTIRDMRQIASQFIKNMHHLITLQIWLINKTEPTDTLQWEGVINNVSYEIAKRHIKIWK